MFEKILERISGKLGPEKREFFIISHKRYRREIYFILNINFTKFPLVSHKQGLF